MEAAFPTKTAVYLKGACLYLLSKWQYDSGGGLCDPYVSLCDAGLLYLFEIMAVQTNIRAGMQYAGKMYAKDAYLSPFVNTESYNPIFRRKSEQNGWTEVLFWEELPVLTAGTPMWIF